MTHDDARRADVLRTRYPDLLGPQDAAVDGADGTAPDPVLLRLIGDLDAVYTAPQPPELLALSIERILAARAEELLPAQRAPTPAATSTLQHHGAHTAKGGTPVTSRRLSLVLGSLAAALVVGLMAVLLLGAGFHLGSVGSGGDNQETFQQRWDRLGGLKIVLRASCPSAVPGCAISARMPQLLAILTRRIVEDLGVDAARYADVRSAQGGFVQIGLAGFTNQRQALIVLGQTGELDFIDTHGQILEKGTPVEGRLCTTSCRADQYPILFTGGQLDPAAISAGADPQTGQAIVTFGFAGATRTQFADYTRMHIGAALTLALDGVIIESAPIQSAITDRGQITGIATLEQAHDLAELIKVVTLPLPLQIALVSLVQVAPHTKSTASCGTPTPPPTPTVMNSSAPSLTPTPTPGVALTAIPKPTAPPTPTPTAASTLAPTPTASDAPPPTATDIVPPPDACPTPTATPTPVPGIPGTPTPIPTRTPPATPTPG
jgi:hypothetical protein